MEIEKELMIADLLMAMYKITASEDTKDMYDIACENLKKYGIDPAPKQDN